MKVIAVLLVALTTVSAGFMRSLPGQILGGQVVGEGLGQNVVSLIFQTLTGWTPCGGTIINPNWVLTDAHCMDGSVSVDVSFGSNSFLSGNLTRTVLAAFFKRDFLYEIGLIPLGNLTLGLNLGNFLLPFSNFTQVGQVGTFFGWDSSIPGPIGENVTVTECNVSTSNTFCTTLLSKCYPPGSPLMVNGELSGFSSWGFHTRCSPESKESIFVKVSAYLDFFQTIEIR